MNRKTVNIKKFNTLKTVKELLDSLDCEVNQLHSRKLYHIFDDEIKQKKLCLNYDPDDDDERCFVNDDLVVGKTLCQMTMKELNKLHKTAEELLCIVASISQQYKNKDHPIKTIKTLPKTSISTTGMKKK